MSGTEPQGGSAPEGGTPQGGPATTWHGATGEDVAAGSPADMMDGSGDAERRGGGGQASTGGGERAGGGRDRAAGGRDRAGGGRRHRRGGGEETMVPDVEFGSYYGRPILKPPAWHDDIAYYFFLGGVSAGSALLGAGADLTGRPALRKGSRIAALGTIAVGSYYLIVDLGRPERFHHMLRVAKPTSPMSMGTWIIAAYAPAAGIAAVSELMPARLRATIPGRLIDLFARPAGLASAVVAPAVASYTAALLSQTAVPAWHEAHPELPFIFTGSAAASAGGVGMLVAPTGEAGPARLLAAYGATVELLASLRLEGRLGVVGEVFHTGPARTELERARWLTTGGALLAVALGRRSRVAAGVSGIALMAGSLYERLGILHAGVASTKDPKYTVVPQRERVEERKEAARVTESLSPGHHLAAPTTDAD